MLHWELDADKHQDDSALEKIRKDRGYSYQVCTTKLMALDPVDINFSSSCCRCCCCCSTAKFRPLPGFVAFVKISLQFVRLRVDSHVVYWELISGNT